MKVEAIILSKSSDLIHYGLTCRTINSLKSSIGWNENNIIVVESEKALDVKQSGYIYPDCDIVYPEETFNYNRFLNIGISNLKQSTDWILICNNDLFFTSHWFGEMENAVMKYSPEILSFSPRSPSWHLHSNDTPDIDVGYEVSRHVCGWCILLHRSLVDNLSLFDESFKFWYQDNDYSMTIKYNDVKHALVNTSKVYHMVSGSHDLITDDKYEMTHGAEQIFTEKWKRYF